MSPVDMSQSFPERTRHATGAPAGALLSPRLGDWPASAGWYSGRQVSWFSCRAAL